MNQVDTANKEFQNEMLRKVCVASGEKAQPVDERWQISCTSVDAHYDGPCVQTTCGLKGSFS